MNLTSNAIYGFTNTLLLPRFDNPKPTPEFHKELWELVTNPHQYVAIAAPRGHAKSTAITHSYVLAMVLFKIRNFVLIVSDTEGQAQLFLGDIKKELQENEDLRKLFNIKKFIKDSETDIIVALEDGHQFRIIAKGSEQKVRGLIWRKTRPNLIIGDDLENDEIVLNEERRDKFKRWFSSALLPCGADDALVRIVGTILHLDSMLESLMPPLDDPDTVFEDLKSYSTNPDRGWLSVRYKAHNEDFSKILWPEKFSKERLQFIRRAHYVEQGFPEGYSQEYLNYPIDESTAFFRKEDFLPIQDSSEQVEYYAAADLAISERDSSAYSVISVCAVNSEGRLKLVDIKRFRGDTWEILNEIFWTHQRYEPEIFFMEQENIARTLGPILYKEMEERGIFINLHMLPPQGQDKIKRARPLQARMRAGKMEFNMEADWFPSLQTEFLQFPKGKYKDQVDSVAWIPLGIEKVVNAPTQRELAAEDYEIEYEETVNFFDYGRSAITGY